MTMQIKLDPGAYMPVRGYETDAGLDLRSPIDITIPRKSSAIIDTGVHCLIPEGYAGVLISKSGLNVKYDITSTGLVDAFYTGSIVCKLDNRGNAQYKVRAGDKITQLVILPVIVPELEVVDELPETDRGSSGFGSTGR